MDAFLLAVGWWNFVGSLLMFGFLNEKFGQKVLNTWTRIFKDDFVLNYWSKLWLFWASGINVFFGLMNIMSVKWGYPEVKIFLIYSDMIAYLLFIGLAVWGVTSKRLGSGAYSVFVVFSGWLIWGCYVLFSDLKML